MMVTPESRRPRMMPKSWSASELLSEAVGSSRMSTRGRRGGRAAMGAEFGSRPPGERRGDGDECALRHAEVADQRRRREARADALEQAFRLAAHGGEVEQ